MFHRSIGRRERTPWTWFAGAVMALLVLAIPPNPSFSDLASTRPEGAEPPDLAFVLPPAAPLTEWVRLMRAQQIRIWWRAIREHQWLCPEA